MVAGCHPCFLGKGPHGFTNTQGCWREQIPSLRFHLQARHLLCLCESPRALKSLIPQSSGLAWIAHSIVAWLPGPSLLSSSFCRTHTLPSLEGHWDRCMPWRRSHSNTGFAFEDHRQALIPREPSAHRCPSLMLLTPRQQFHILSANFWCPSSTFT